MSRQDERDHAGSPADQDRADQDRAALAATVERLRDEVDGLRQAMRSRAVIEQAKGMMMERHGISTDEAFDRLAKLSQHANVKLVDVAAALVDTSATQAGAPAPPAPAPGDRPTPADVARQARQQGLRWPTQGSGSGEIGRRIRAQGRGARIRAELMAATAADDVLATVVGTASGDHPPDAAAIAVLDVNGVLRTVSSHGVPSTLAARWRHLPVDLPLLGCVAARTGQAQWLGPGQACGSAIGFGLDGDYAAAALLPLAVNGDRGVLAMVWTQDLELDDAARADLERLAAGVGVAVGRLPGTAGPGADLQADVAADPMVAVLDVLYDCVILCQPLTGQDGRVVDLRLLHANPSATDPRGRTLAGETGRSVVELLPDLVGADLLTACEQVWRTGAQAELLDRPRRVVVDGQSRTSRSDLRVTRYRDGLMITWSRTATGDARASEER